MDHEPQTKKRRSSGTAGGYKRFEDLGNKQKLNRTNDLLQMINDFVAKENQFRSANDHQLFTSRNLLGYLLYRIEWTTDKQMAEVGLKLLRNESLNSHQSFDSNRIHARYDDD